jgi:iron complex transport system substrate-binding protein
VKSLLSDAVSIYSVHADVLQRLQPDVIVTQSQCDVCAVSLKDVEQAVCTLVGSQPRVVSLEPNGLADIWTTFRQVAAALDVSDRGEKLITELQGRLDAIRRRCAQLPTRPTVACIEWIEPLMAAGNWVPELVG